MDLGLHGRTAAVAAASTGLGFASARALAAEGVTVAICGRDTARIEAAAALIGPTVIPLTFDVGSGEGAEAFVGAATAALGGGPDILSPTAAGRLAARSSRPGSTTTAPRSTSTCCPRSRCVVRRSPR